MYSSGEKFHIHYAKRYLQYTETEEIRAFSCTDYPELAAFNFAVLKSAKNVKDAIANAEKYFEWRDEYPVSFHSAPDSLKILEAKKVFTANNYKVKTYYTTYFEYVGKPTTQPKIIDCKTDIIEKTTSWPQRPLVRVAFGGKDDAAGVADIKMQCGAKAFFAYNKAGVPISFCMGESYGSAFCISHVYTPQPIRRQGCATAVINAALKYALSNGYSDIFTYAPDKSNKKLFEQFGFKGKQIECYWATKGKEDYALPPLY